MLEYIENENAISVHHKGNLIATIEPCESGYQWTYHPTGETDCRDSASLCKYAVQVAWAKHRIATAGTLN